MSSWDFTSGDIKRTTSIPTPSAITVVICAYVPSAPGANFTLFSLDDAGANFFQLAAESAHANLGMWSENHSGGSNGVTMFSMASLAGKWCRVVLVGAPTTSVGYWRVDGASTISTATIETSTQTPTAAFIGQDGFATGRWPGLIGFAAVYNRSFSAAEARDAITFMGRKPRSWNGLIFWTSCLTSSPENDQGNRLNWTKTGSLSTSALDPGLPWDAPELTQDDPPPATIAVGTSFFAQETRLLVPPLGRGHYIQDPILPMSAIAVGTPWAAEGPQPRSRQACFAPSSFLPPPAPASAQTMTWASHSPALVRTTVATDGGAGAISPLNPPHGTWYPDAPDIQRPRRWTRDEPGSGLQRPLAAPAVVFVQPDAAWAPRKRPQTESGSGFGERPLYLANLSWSGSDPGRPQQRRPISEDRSLQAPPAAGAYDLAWAAQGHQVVVRLLRQGADAIPVLLPVFQPQAPSWLPQPADVVRRDVKPQNGGSADVLRAMAQATDLSWARDPDLPAARRPPQHTQAFTPQATTVTLSAWGWIPEVPSRPGLRTVVNTPVSALIPPAILTTMPWGWIPEQPDRGFRRAPNTHQDQPPITVLAMQALGWLAESPQPRPRRPVDGSSASFLGQPAVATWGWLHDQAQPGKRRSVLEDPGQVPPAPTQVVSWGWFVEALPARPPAPRPREDAQSPLRPLAGLPAYWQHWQVGPRAPRPVVSGYNETPLLVLVPASLPAMPPGDGSFIVARSAVALRAAIAAGYGTILVPSGAVTAGDLKAIMQEVGAWRAVLRE